MKKISFIINGTAKGKDRLIGKLRENLIGHEVIFYETTYAGEAMDLAQKAVTNSTDILIAVGGDGSLNEVVNGCLRCEPELTQEVTMGVFPFGSGNDFARSIGVSADVEQLHDLINSNTTVPVDIGKVHFTNSEGGPAQRHFINIMDVGIGGNVAVTLSRSPRFLGPHINYHRAILQSFLTYRPMEVTLNSENFNWKGHILSLIMANGKYFANGMCIAPQASVTDGGIQLVILGNVSVWDYLMNMAKIKRGEIIDDPEITYVKVNSCHIDAEKFSCPIDMDGEFIGYAPLKLEVMKGALRFLGSTDQTHILK